MVKEKKGLCDEGLIYASIFSNDLNLQRQKRSFELCDVNLALNGDLWNHVSIQRCLHRHFLNSKHDIGSDECAVIAQVLIYLYFRYYI